MKEKAIAIVQYVLEAEWEGAFENTIGWDHTLEKVPAEYQSRDIMVLIWTREIFPVFKGPVFLPQY